MHLCETDLQKEYVHANTNTHDAVHETLHLISLTRQYCLLTFYLYYNRDSLNKQQK